MKTHISGILTFALLAIFSTSLLAQSSGLYVPLDIQAAYKKASRSKEGTPGARYWQNRSDYQIKVELERPRMIHGQATITYTNNSPDTLRQIVIRLYQDRYRKNNMRDSEIAVEDLHDGVEIKKLTVNGKSVSESTAMTRRRGTNLFVTLPSPLMPKSQLTLSVDWSSQLPGVSDGRGGIYHDASYFVAYWYPQIAVYDDINGWDTFNYLGTQEFYNDFGNFDVEITAPANFIVWATGMLQNPDEVLNAKYASRFKAAQTSEEIVKIIAPEDLKKKDFTRGKNKNTWKFRAEYVPDFAFATSSDYLWDATSVVVDNAGRRVTTASAYHPAARDFYEVAQVAQQTVASLSKDLPGIPFPYPQVTVFNGEGGMEFPMMVNDGSVTQREEMVYVTSHEIAHTYFPFYMGINERKYAWMDEGWAQMLPNDLQKRLAPLSDPDAYNSGAYLMAAGREMEMPLSVPSTMLTGLPYAISAYMRPAMAYLFLRDFLGEELFRKALREYMNRWNGKHPIPYDFFYTFNAVANENLEWYWKPWFFEQGYPDLGLKNIDSSNNRLRFTVEKKGNLPVPVSATITFMDGTQETYYQSAAIWKDGKSTLVVEKQYGKAVKKIQLGNQVIPDVDRSDNVYLITQ